MDGTTTTSKTARILRSAPQNSQPLIEENIFCTFVTLVVEQPESAPIPEMNRADLGESVQSDSIGSLQTGPDPQRRRVTSNTKVGGVPDVSDV